MVAGVTRVLYELGGNIEDASMTRLGGEFTMMLITALPEIVSASALTKSLNVLEKKLGVMTTVKAIPQAASTPAKTEPPRGARLHTDLIGSSPSP